MVTQSTISGWGGTNPMTGEIQDRASELYGQNFTGKILVFRGAKGSSGWSHAFHLAKVNGTAPKAILFNEMTTKIALGSVCMEIPAVTDLEQNPLEQISSGDYVKVFADKGYIEIIKK
ncbi:DUF126 domain-containing protein [Bacteroides sp. OttesenSCG-928-J23]|nr:DUF126 domain-containing protein [Bacteroides sp. OttesenSCG-928-J23]